MSKFHVYFLSYSAILIALIVIISAQNNNRKTNYNEQEARAMLLLCAGAYGQGNQHQQCVDRALPGTSEREIVMDFINQTCDGKGNPCECYIVASHSIKTLFIIFRGTKTDSQLILEGISTLNLGTDFLGMGNVNDYFLNGHNVLWPGVQNTLRNPRYNGYKIIVTGHSLGGALASLTAIRIVRENYRPNSMVKLITFGQPRTGSLQYAKSYDNMRIESYRVVNAQDIIPHSPACQKNNTLGIPDDQSKPCDQIAIEKPYHHGIEIWYPRSMSPGSQYIECLNQPYGEDFSCSDRLKFDSKNSKTYIADHRHYFNLQVPKFGQTGCDSNFPEGYPESDDNNKNVIQKAAEGIKTIANIIG